MRNAEGKMPPWERLIRAVSVVLWLYPGRGESRNYPAVAAGRYYDSYRNDVDYTNSFAAKLTELPWYNPSNNKEPFCYTGTGYTGVYPAGFDIAGGREIFLPLLDSEDLTVSKCLEKCCNLGKSRCQYIWIFKSKCIAVSCSSSRNQYCDYVTVPSHLSPSDSIYITVEFDQSHSVPSSAPPTPSYPPLPSPVDQPTLYYHNLPEVSIYPANVVTTESKVSLSAQLKDHQELSEIVLEYYWKLVSAEPPRNQRDFSMTGMMSSTVHLSSLSPGVYVLQLTLRDPSSDLTSSVSTTVTVLSAQNSPPLAASIVPKTSSSTASESHSGTLALPSPITEPSKPRLAMTTTYQSGQSTTTIHQSVPEETPEKKPSVDSDQNESKLTTTYQTKVTDMYQNDPNDSRQLIIPTPNATPVVVQDISTDSSPSDYSLYIKVGVPVLSIVLLILILSGCIVAVSSFIFFNSQNNTQKYRYRRLIYTDA